jgi:hypothetical protein
MEIVIRTDDGETVANPPSGSETSPAQATDARTGTNAGEAPSPPDQGGVPPANVAATEPPRAATGADQSAGAAPQPT